MPKTKMVDFVPAMITGFYFKERKGITPIMSRKGRPVDNLFSSSCQTTYKNNQAIIRNICFFNIIPLLIVTNFRA